MFDIKQYPGENKYEKSVYFNLPEEKFNEFKNGSLEEQKTILKDFFKNVINEISKPLD